MTDEGPGLGLGMDEPYQHAVALMDHVIADLGESPEAWRGAVLIAIHIQGLIGAGLHLIADHEVDGEKMGDLILVGLTGMTNAVLKHPAAVGFPRTCRH